MVYDAKQNSGIYKIKSHNATPKSICTVFVNIFFIWSEGKGNKKHAPEGACEKLLVVFYLCFYIGNFNTCNVNLCCATSNYILKYEGI